MKVFSNKQQALILAIAAMFISLGNAAAIIPSFTPEEIRYYIAGFFWVCGIVGFALKELGGYEAPKEEK